MNNKKSKKNTKKVSSSNKVNYSEITIGIEKKLSKEEMNKINKKKKQKQKEKIKKENKEKKKLDKEKKKIKKLKREKKQIIEKPKKEKKKKSKARKIIIITVIILIAIYLFFLIVPIFKIDNIIIEGNNIISKEEIIRLSKIEQGDNLISTFSLKISNRLKENKYIDSVEIQKRLPNEIYIKIVERNPKFLISFEGGFAYLDSQGYLLDMSLERREEMAVTTLRGLTTQEKDLIKNGRLEREDLKRLNTIIKIFDVAKVNEIDNLITGINIINQDQFVLEFAGERKEAYLGKADNLATRISIIKQILEKEKNTSGKIFVDMDLDSKREAYYRENL